MCGIAGFVSRAFGKDDLVAMTNRLHHRGPDAEGYLFDGAKGIGLGHKRLKIIDLSSAANQPFFSGDRRYALVFNGEVYNFRELQVKYGIHPRTSSDTEIIIEAFAKAGPACLADLNGMFAMAIWDDREQKLFLIRDRVGVKPLYYLHDEGQIFFASELKALYSLPLSLTISDSSVSSYLYLGYVPAEDTIYTQIRKLMPGRYAEFHRGRLHIAPYWHLDDQIAKETLDDEKVAKKKLNEILHQSLRYCMISDVPVGIFLSGGIDSSTVAAIAQDNSSRPVKTFSIGFREGKYNEAPFARQVAKHIGSDHEEFTVTQGDALALVEKLTGIYDEPYADSSAIPTYMVSQLARKKVTVALSGDGGDELFMGYSFYYWARRLQNPLIRAFRKPIGNMLSHSGAKRLERASMLFNYPSSERMKSHIFSQEQYYFSEREICELLRRPAPVRLDEEIVSPRKLSPEEQQSFFDIRNYLPEELLVKTDRASMQHALEVRVPLLDYHLVQFAVNLSPRLKLRGKTGKYLLKQVLYDYVPAALFDRPKWGFAIPLRIWLGRELSYLLDKYLSPAVVEECGLVKPGPVQELRRRFLGGRDYLYNRLWSLVLLHQWYLERRA
ncbi:MAG TPA: asparagine synthase (glutamine-hydrolyzing) [Chitinophagaceae bacterium]|nr:asparagine synthase (glutamine-hydrolyzing) [Chitinophagaceae bacterium]